MNKLIENYIYAVTKRCNPKNREEIQKELESNIFDMLGDNLNPTDLEIETVLQKIGNPIKVAFSYRTEENHIIHPMFYNDYISVLKIVLIGFISITIFSNILSIVFNSNIESLEAFLENFITLVVSDALNSAFVGFTLVTILFWFSTNEKYNGFIFKYLNNWKASDLMDKPKENKSKNKESRLSIFTEMFFTFIFYTFFIYLLIFNFDFLAVIVNLNDTIPIFNIEVRSLLITSSFIVYVLSLIYYIYYFVKGKKNLTSTILNSIIMIISVLAAVIIMSSPNLFSIELIDFLAKVFETTSESISINMGYFIQWSIAITIIALIIEQSLSWVKYFKSNS